MSIATTISAKIMNLLPPCLESQMKQAVKRMDLMRLGTGSWTDGYKPVGMHSGFRITTLVKDSVTLFAGKPAEFIGKVAQTTFTNEDLKPGVAGFHQVWHVGGRTCENLSVIGVSSVEETITNCYEGPFTGGLLARVCKVTSTQAEPSLADRFLGRLVGEDYETLKDSSRFERFNLGPGYPDTKSNWMPSVAQAVGGVAGAIGLYKAVREYQAGNRGRALAWTTMSVAAFVLPNINLS